MHMLGRLIWPSQCHQPQTGRHSLELTSPTWRRLLSWPLELAQVDGRMVSNTHATSCSSPIPLSGGFTSMCRGETTAAEKEPCPVPFTFGSFAVMRHYSNQPTASMHRTFASVALCCRISIDAVPGVQPSHSYAMGHSSKLRYVAGLANCTTRVHFCTLGRYRDKQVVSWNFMAALVRRTISLPGVWSNVVASAALRCLGVFFLST